MLSERPTGGNQVRAGGGGANGGKPPSGGFSNLLAAGHTHRSPPEEGRRILVGGAHFGFDQAAGISKTLSFVIPWDTVEMN